MSEVIDTDINRPLQKLQFVIKRHLWELDQRRYFVFVNLADDDIAKECSAVTPK